ncbi:MAG: NADH-quinone oxidoreductase subunit NuoE [bacterium]|jgi:NADH-quinone oxidoreductase E subunit
MLPKEPGEKEVQELCAGHPQHPGELLALLLEIQETYHYLPPTAMKEVARYLAVPESQVYAVATFYKALTLKPQGKKIIRICQGTACHLRGSSEVLETIKEVLGIAPGETTTDGCFTLETVNCLGACALAPVVMIGDETHGQMTPERIRKLLQEVST